MQGNRMPGVSLHAMRQPNFGHLILSEKISSNVTLTDKLYVDMLL